MFVRQMSPVIKIPQKENICWERRKPTRQKRNRHCKTCIIFSKERRPQKLRNTFLKYVNPKRRKEKCNQESPTHCQHYWNRTRSKRKSVNQHTNLRHSRKAVAGVVKGKLTFNKETTKISKEACNETTRATGKLWEEEARSNDKKPLSSLRFESSRNVKGEICKFSLRKISYE